MHMFAFAIHILEYMDVKAADSVCGKHCVVCSDPVCLTVRFPIRQTQIRLLNIQKLPRVLIPPYEIAEAIARPNVNAKREPCLIIKYISEINKKQRATAV